MKVYVLSVQFKQLWAAVSCQMVLLRQPADASADVEDKLLLHLEALSQEQTSLKSQLT